MNVKQQILAKQECERQKCGMIFFQIEKLLFLKVKGIDHVEKCTSSSSNNYAMHFSVKETKEGKTSQ